MARPRKDQTVKLARGQRLASIREGLGLTQDAIVERLNAAAARLGLPANYRYYTVSRMESGTISFEDAAVWLSLTNGARDWNWLVFGEGGAHHATHPAARPMRASPKPASASAHKRATPASGRGR